jgi:hypothetical protein
VVVRGRTRTFVDSTGSQAIRGLQESLMASRTFGAAVGPPGADGAAAMNLLCYTFQPMILTNVMVLNASGETWDQATSILSIVFYATLSDPPVGELAIVTGFNLVGGGGSPFGEVNMADAAQLASIGSTSRALKPTLIPAGHQVIVKFDNNEGAGPVGIMSCWEAATTPERVFLEPRIPATPSSENLNTVLI